MNIFLVKEELDITKNEGDTSDRVALCYFISSAFTSSLEDKKYSYSFEKYWNSYCLFGEYLLSLYYHEKANNHPKQKRYGKDNT